MKIDYRWQSIPALKEALIDILESENQKDNKNETVLDKIRNKLSASTSHSEQRELFHTLVKQTVEQIPDVVKDLIKELGSDFEIMTSGAYSTSYYRIKDWEKFKFSTQHLISIN